MKSINRQDYVLILSTIFVLAAMIWVGRDVLHAEVVLSLVCVAVLALIVYSFGRGAFGRRSLTTLISLVSNANAPSVILCERGDVVFENAGYAALRRPPLDYLGAAPRERLVSLIQRARTKGSSEDKTVDGRRISITHDGGRYYICTVGMIEKTELTVPSIMVAQSGDILERTNVFDRMFGNGLSNLDNLDPNWREWSGRDVMLPTQTGLTRFAAHVMTEGADTRVTLLPRSESAEEILWSEVENLPVALLNVSRTGEILAANRECRHLLGVEMAGATRLPDVLEGLGRPIVDWLSDVADGKTTACREFLRGTGAKKDFFVQVALHPAADGHTLTAVLTDMSEFKSLEAQFVQSQKMQAIGQLAGGIAHDFNNLLTAITGHCDLILMRGDAGVHNLDDLSQIHENADRAAALVKQLLAFSRKQTLEPEVINVADAIDALAVLLDRLVGEKVQLSIHREPETPNIRVDSRQLEQVLMNLVVNAKDAMPAGGDIRIESSVIALEETIERQNVRLKDGEYVLIRVIDEGFGIPADNLHTIFEPFYTTKPVGEGTGLGLSTAYGIVKQSGGFIFAESEVGEGTTFSIYFPRAGAEATAQMAPKAQAEETVITGGRILLVEDERSVRAFAARALSLKGYEVTEADSGEAALEAVRAAETPFDLFVTDVIMPGLDGPGWVTEAFATHPQTRVVFMSGYAEDAFSDQKTRVKDSRFVSKPFSLDKLVSTVEDAMR